jgi:hypothetical protein
VRYFISLILILGILISGFAFGLPAIPVSAAIELELDPARGNVGDEVSVDFTNWDSESDLSYNLFFGSIKVISAITSSSTKHFNIPNGAGGDYKVTLRNGSTTIIATATFTVEPEISVSPPTAQVGDKISISGTGFLGKKPVSVSFNNIDISDYETDTYGSFSTTFALPEVVYGSNRFIARDIDKSADDTVFVTPKIVLSSTTPAVGDKITLSGSGFSGSSKINVSVDEINTSITATTNSNGAFSNKQLTIPIITAGSHILTVKDAANHSTSVTLNTSQSISISPKSGPADTEITVTGGGFTPNKAISIKYKGIDIATIPASVSSDSSGSFSLTFKAPKFAAGVYSVIITQGTLIADASFTQTSMADIDPKTGPVGSTVTASGSGFNTNAKITVKYDEVDIASSIADTSGSFSTPFKVPAGQAGKHKVTITDSINSFSKDFTATAAAFLDAATGNVGSEININGNAFTPGSTIKIKYDSIETASVLADAGGSFTTSLKIPVSKGGPHNITFSDSSTSTVVVFNVESIPPPVPVLAIPINGEKSDALTNFQWNAVTDPSNPVTYTLQIARDAAFATLFFEKPGLTTANYQLGELQKLKASDKDKPYYWRVKAIDAASNESAWSTPRYFSVGATLPNWVWIIVFVLGGIVLIIAGFFAGRKWTGDFDFQRFFKFFKRRRD